MNGNDSFSILKERDVLPQLLQLKDVRHIKNASTEFQTAFVNRCKRKKCKYLERCKQEGFDRYSCTCLSTLERRLKDKQQCRYSYKAITHEKSYWKYFGIIRNALKENEYLQDQAYAEYDPYQFRFDANLRQVANEIIKRYKQQIDAKSDIQSR